MTEQPRVPPGDPRGGQFASSPRAEAGAVLDAVYREDEGSFYYPPAPTTYEALLRFWSNTPIPEEALARFERGYEQSFQDRLLADLTRWREENPEPRNDRARARWDADREEYKRDLQAREPRMYASWVRPLVRLDRMYAYRGSLSRPEQDRFLAQQYSLPGGPTGSVQDLLGMFRTSDYNHVLRQTELDDHAELVDQLRQTTAELRQIRSGV